MDKFYALPIVVEAERWDGEQTYGGRIQEIWFMRGGRAVIDYSSDVIVRGLISRPLKDGEKQVLTKNDWIIRYADGDITAMDDIEFKSKFTRVR